MSYSRGRRSASPHTSISPIKSRRSRSLSRSHQSQSRSRESEDASNPGNNLYITGLSTRVTTSDLEKYFGKEGKVLECHLVTDPRTRESRGFAFVAMETIEDADRCVKYLNRSVLEGRVITVEKVLYVLLHRNSQSMILTVEQIPSQFTAQVLQQHFKPTDSIRLFCRGVYALKSFSSLARRSRGRTPTPGRYHGQRERQGRGQRSCSSSPRRWDSRDRDNYSRDRRGRSRSPYSRRGDDYHAYRRRRDRSLSADLGYRR